MSIPDLVTPRAAAADQRASAASWRWSAACSHRRALPAVGVRARRAGQHDRARLPVPVQFLALVLGVSSSGLLLASRSYLKPSAKRRVGWVRGAKAAGHRGADLHRADHHQHRRRARRSGQRRVRRLDRPDRRARSPFVGTKLMPADRAPNLAAPGCRPWLEILAIAAVMAAGPLRRRLRPGHGRRRLVRLVPRLRRRHRRGALSPRA